MKVLLIMFNLKWVNKIFSKILLNNIFFRFLIILYVIINFLHKYQLLLDLIDFLIFLINQISNHIFLIILLLLKLYFLSLFEVYCFIYLNWVIHHYFSLIIISNFWLPHSISIFLILSFEFTLWKLRFNFHRLYSLV